LEKEMVWNGEFGWRGRLLPPMDLGVLIVQELRDGTASGHGTEAREGLRVSLPALILDGRRAIEVVQGDCITRTLIRGPV
jgi:hypothetical protein